MRGFDEFLGRDQDRALFDLPPTAKRCLIRGLSRHLEIANLPGAGTGQSADSARGKQVPVGVTTRQYVDVLDADSLATNY